MVKLYKRDNLYSVNKLKKSDLVELDDITYSGVILGVDETGEKYHATTVDGKIFKLTQDNLNMIVRGSHIENGRIVGKLSWQSYKNKALFLPIGTLDPKNLEYGDVVEPILFSYFDSHLLVYLGQKHLVEYTTALEKRVRKSQHVFVSMDKSSYKKVNTQNIINSAYFILRNDKKLADELLAELNTNKIEQRHPYHDKYGRIFYVDDYYKTKLIPKLVALNQTTSNNSLHDARQVIKVDDNFYDVKYLHTRNPPHTKSGIHSGYLLKNIEVVEDPDYVANLNYGFMSTKYIDLKKIDIEVPANYDCYVVAYELYQNGNLIGRK